MVPDGNGQFLGVYWPLKKHCESLLNCTLHVLSSIFSAAIDGTLRPSTAAVRTLRYTMQEIDGMTYSH